MFIVLALALSLPATLLGDSPARPRSYRVPTPDQKHVFVMLAPYEEPISPVPTTLPSTPFWRDHETIWHQQVARAIEAQQEILHIRQTYPQSGLYRNDGTTTPLWTVNWYAFEVEPLSDAIHLVRHGPWASDISDEAISFFANGNLVRTHEVRDVVDTPGRLRHSVSHFQWQDRPRELSADEKQYLLTTNDGNTILFDTHSGRIISRSRHLFAWLLDLATDALLAAIAASLATAIVAVARRNRSGAGAVEVPPDADIRRFRRIGRICGPFVASLAFSVLLVVFLIILDLAGLAGGAHIPESHIHRWEFGAVPILVWAAVVAISLPVMALLWLPTLCVAIWRDCRHSARYMRGVCLRCGYDLRASPIQCPECGTIVSDPPHLVSEVLLEWTAIRQTKLLSWRDLKLAMLCTLVTWPFLLPFGPRVRSWNVVFCIVLLLIAKAAIRSMGTPEPMRPSHARERVRQNQTFP